MPKLADLSVEIGSNTYVYKPSSNIGGVAGFSLANETLRGGGHFAVGVRKVLPTQKARKATVTYSDPLVTECEQTCAPIDRGVIHFRLENMVAPDASAAERGLAYDRFIALLQQSDVRLAVINNEPFFS